MVSQCSDSLSEKKNNNKKADELPWHYVQNRHQSCSCMVELTRQRLCGWKCLLWHHTWGNGLFFQSQRDTMVWNQPFWNTKHFITMAQWMIGMHRQTHTVHCWDAAEEGIGMLCGNVLLMLNTEAIHWDKKNKKRDKASHWYLVQRHIHLAQEVISCLRERTHRDINKHLHLHKTKYRAREHSEPKLANIP